MEPKYFDASGYHPVYEQDRLAIKFFLYPIRNAFFRSELNEREKEKDVIDKNLSFTYDFSTCTARVTNGLESMKNKP